MQKKAPQTDHANVTVLKTELLRYTKGEENVLFKNKPRRRT